jgi:serine/threonine protein kinase
MVGSEGAGYYIDQTEPMAYGRESVLWVAQDNCHQEVCLKIFRDVDAVPAQMFRELTAVRALQHPGILPVIDFQSSGPSPFLVLPLCKGGSLRAMLTEKRFIPLDQALAVVRPIAQALDFAHANGFIHGDIKPENILFLDEARTRPLLSDFGMSKHFGHTVRLRESTTLLSPDDLGLPRSSGAAGGTFAYMSPEQFDTGRVSTRTDIYSLSLVVFELLTGQFPYDTDRPVYHFIRQKLDDDLRDAHSLNPAVTPEAADVLKDGLSADPEKRPRRAMDLCDQLTGSVRLPRRRPIGRALRPLVTAAEAARRFWRDAGVAGRVTLVATILTVLGSIVAALVQAMFGS